MRGMHRFLGVDVGTHSVRACVVASDGRVVGFGEEGISTVEGEQSSEEIWAKVVIACRAALGSIDDVDGIGFCATCSLVSFGSRVSEMRERDVILWADHRAVEEAERVNGTNAHELKFVGGAVSPEMNIPKVLWLQKNLPTEFEKAKHFFDLPDFLTFKATGSLSRSLCSLVCKWNFRGEEGRWDDDFLRKLGIHEIKSKLGRSFLKPGQPIQGGLSAEAAFQLCLRAGTPVSSSLIDAHCGALGTLGAFSEDSSLENRMTIIAGTSSCFISLKKELNFCSGIWGPYIHAVLPDLYCFEAGQSAAGEFLRHVVECHVASNEIQGDKFKALQARLNEMADGSFEKLTILSEELLLTPDINGNRSPFANPRMLPVILGKIAPTFDGLAALFLAAIQALAYSTKSILLHMKKELGFEIHDLVVCGGLSRNRIFTQTIADVLQIAVKFPANPEAVSVGAAILGASASGILGDFRQAARALNKENREETIRPNDNLTIRNFHSSKFEQFMKVSFTVQQ